MSGPAIAWAVEQGCSHRLTPCLRLLLQYLAFQADDSGASKPGQTCIREHTGLSLSTIRTGGQRLARKGLIAIEERAGMATQYRLNIAVNGEDPATEPPQTVTGYPHNPLQGAPTIGDGVTPTNRYRVPGTTPTNDDRAPPQIVTPTPAECDRDRARTPQTLPFFNQEEEKESKLTPSVSPPCDSETTKGAPSAAAPPKSEAAPGGASTRGHQLPASWSPNDYSLSLGTELGLSVTEIAAEAEAMRDWAIHAGKPGKDWDRRFNNWLRTEAKRRYIRKIRNQPKQTLAEEWGLKSFLLDDDELPFSERPASTRLQ